MSGIRPNPEQFQQLARSSEKGVALRPPRHHPGRSRAALRIDFSRRGWLARARADRPGLYRPAGMKAERVESNPTRSELAAQWTHHAASGRGAA